LLLLAVVCFPAYWLNSAYARQQLADVAEKYGVTLSYGEITSFSWWSGISLNRLHLRQDGADVRLDMLNYAWPDKFRVKQARVELPMALLQGSASTQPSSGPVDFPAMLALLPKDMAFEKFELALPQGAVYQGALELILNREMGLETTLNGLWSLPVGAGQGLQGPLTASFNLNLVRNRLTLKSLSASHAASSVALKQVVVEELLGSPRVAGASLQASLHPESLDALPVRWLPDIPRFEQINVQIDRFSFDGSAADLLLKELRVDGAGGNQVMLAGPIAWQMGAGGSQQISSPGLTFMTDIPGPQGMGLPLQQHVHWQGDIQFSMQAGEEGMVALHSLGLKSALWFGDKREAPRWQADVSFQELELSQQQAHWGMATALLLGDRNLKIVGQEIRAGRYSLQLSDSALSFGKEGRVGWHARGGAQLAMQGMPAFALKIQSSGVRQGHVTRIKRLKLEEEKLGLSASLQGTLHDAGVDHRASRMQGRVKVKNLAAFKPWLVHIPAVQGAVSLAWSSLGRGMGRLESKGEIRLSNLSLQADEQYGTLHVDGASLILPFRQSLDLTRGLLSGGAIELNRAQLYALGDGPLAGRFTLKSAAVGGIHLDDLSIGLSLQNGLLIGRIDRGSLLDGSVAGAWMVRYPSGHAQRFPHLFTRLSLLHANSAALHPGKGYAASYLNLYTTLKSDGSDISGRFSVPQINRQSLEHLMDWVDPKREQAALKGVRQAIEEYGYAPSTVDARLKERYLDVDVVLQTLHGSRLQIPVHNMSVGHLLDAP